jgi:hypothetical protein
VEQFEAVDVAFVDDYTAARTGEPVTGPLLPARLTAV